MAAGKERHLRKDGGAREGEGEGEGTGDADRELMRLWRQDKQLTCAGESMHTTQPSSAAAPSSVSGALGAKGVPPRLCPLTRADAIPSAALAIGTAPRPLAALDGVVVAGAGGVTASVGAAPPWRQKRCW